MREFMKWIELASATVATLFCAGFVYFANASTPSRAELERFPESASIERQLAASTNGPAK